MIHKGTCHCGNIKFEAELIDGLNTARRCDCTMCSKRGGIAVGALREKFVITSGVEFLSLYQFNSKTAEHYFCSNCGIYTHHRRRSNQDEVGINVACLEGISPFDFDEVLVLDGINHPNDNKNSGSDHIAGVLRYEKQ